MLTPKQIKGLQDAAEKTVDPIIEFLLRDIARRVSEAGQLTSTAAYQIWKVQELGISQKQVKKEIQKILKVSAEDAEKLMQQSAEVGYRFDLSRLPTAAAIPFAANATLQQQLKSAKRLAKKDFSNLTQTLGMVGPDGKVYPLQKAYHKATDFAFKQVFTGASDYNTAVRNACRNLAKYGVRVIDYESGVTTKLEAAIRRNIMGGIGLMQEQISQETHDRMGATGWEISAHPDSAPDHEPYQGRQYSDAEYKRLNNSLNRRIGTLNCGHIAYPVILGVSAPVYSEAELQEMQEQNQKGITYQGRHYSLYEASQKQRQIERAMRSQKNYILTAEGAGDADAKLAHQIKLKRLESEYKKFSSAAGLTTQKERAWVAGWGKKEAAEASKAVRKNVEKYRQYRYNEDGTIIVTDDWKEKEKPSIPKAYRPHAVIESKIKYRSGKIQIDRSIYDSEGMLKRQVHSSDHSRPKQHRFGEDRTEPYHVHEYTWGEDGVLEERTTRSLTDEEKIENADLLGGGKGG